MMNKLNSLQLYAKDDVHPPCMDHYICISDSTLYNKTVMIQREIMATMRPNRQLHVWKMNLSTHMYHFSTHTPLRWGAGKWAEKVSTYKTVAGGTAPTKYVCIHTLRIHEIYIPVVYDWSETIVTLLLEPILKMGVMMV